ncbi:acetyltransferase, GNAT family [Synechococcus sp. PCC 7335]|nr:acetyltransferase, GNAT family [Synechococcus sp. PCC 7335]
MSYVTLRPTRQADLDFVIAAERHPDNAPYVGQWTLEQHKDAIASQNNAHLIVEKTSTATHFAQSMQSADRHSIGYVILVGLQDPHLSLLLKRIVILPKGKGFGRKTLQWVKRFTFEQLGYHRLALDVVGSNQRAQRLYRSEGFVDEGKLREAYKTPTGYEDLLLLSILESEYATNPS